MVAAAGLVLVFTLALSWALVLVAMPAANPVSLLSDAMRGLMASGPAARPAVESLLYAAAFTIAFVPLAVV